MTFAEASAYFDRRTEAWNRRDAEALLADYADDCVVESPMSGVLRGRAAVGAVYKHWFSAFPDLSFEPHELLSMGTRVAQIVSFVGTDTGGFLDQPPTRKPFGFRCIFWYDLVNGQIRHERRVYDLHGVLMQLAIGPTHAYTPAEAYQTTLDRARMAQELRMAAEIQRLLLPQGSYRGNGFQVAATSLPCRAIGGDFFDYYELPDGAFGFSLGDVAGKGPAAALLAGQLLGVMAAHASASKTVAETVRRVNEVVVRRTIASRFATLWYGVLASDGRLTYCNAGHNPPLLIGQHSVRRLTTGGMIVGAFNGAMFEEETVQLDRGDLLVVFSDGVTEAFNAEGGEFGEDRLLSCLLANRELPLPAVVDCLIDTIRQFRSRAEQSDDLTVLAVRRDADAVTA